MTKRSCLERQTKQKPKFVLLCYREWEIQCNCVGKLVNHCYVAKTTKAQKIGRKRSSSHVDQHKNVTFWRFVLPAQWKFQLPALARALLTFFKRVQEKWGAKKPSISQCFLFI